MTRTGANETPVSGWTSGVYYLPRQLCGEPLAVARHSQLLLTCDRLHACTNPASAVLALSRRWPGVTNPRRISICVRLPGWVVRFVAPSAPRMNCVSSTS